jgi:hypothetical protein
MNIFVHTCLYIVAFYYSTDFSGMCLLYVLLSFVFTVLGMKPGPCASALSLSYTSSPLFHLGCFLFVCFIFEISLSCYVAKAGLKLMILLPPEC